MIGFFLFITLVSLSFSTIADCSKNVSARNKDCHKPIRQTKGKHHKISKTPFKDSKVLSEVQFTELVDALSGTEYGRRINVYAGFIDRRYPGHEVVFFEFNQYAFRNYLYTQEEIDRLQSASVVVIVGGDKLDFRPNHTAGRLHHLAGHLGVLITDQAPH